MSQVIAIGPYSDTDAAALARDFDARRLPDLAAIAALPEDQRRDIVAVAFMGHDPFGGAVMDLLPGLKAITNFGVGYDAIDVAAATARGIRVTNTPNVLNDDVADLAVAMWIAQARDFEPAIQNARSGDWGRGVRLPLARKASEGFVSAGVIGALGPDGVIVNIARGSVIDEEALIAALQSGAIRGAALDVFRGEPQVDPRLLAAPNLLALPHIGSATVETRAAMGQGPRANLRAILDGRAPETPVN